MQLSPHIFAPTDSAQGTVVAPRGLMLFGDDGLSFRDVLDLVNPLQHIPVVGNLYRKLTGDTLDPAIRVAGGALFGGPLGAVLSLGSLLVEQGSNAAAVSPGLKDASNALAEARSSQPYRGGWMVNAAMTGRLPQLVSSPTPATETVVRSSAKVAESNHPEVRRGGWIVAQAYALSDLPRATISTPAGQIDDAV